jgi:hypothetical protein
MSVSSHSPNKETDVIILLPLLCRLSARTRMALGLALTLIGLFLILSALAHGVIAVIVGAILLLSTGRGRYASREYRRRRVTI